MGLTFDMDHYEDVSFGDHPEQRLDVWELNDLAPRDGWPAVLFLHGGGWVQGKQSSFRIQAPLLARHGILCASASFRLGPEWRWPTQIEDVLAAFEELCCLQVDPRRIGIWGVSTGGHLALRAAQILGPERVRAVVTLGAPTDLEALDPRDWPELEQVFSPEQLRGASPAVVQDPLPPVLALHGELDRVVPFSQAEALAAAHESVRLVKVRGDHLLRLPPGAGLRPLASARRWMAGQVARVERRSKWRGKKKKG